MAKTITVGKTKSDVYLLVEGLSSNIGKKNPDIDFEAIWASEGDERSLDIYYREAVGDLEEHLQRWITESTEKPDVTDYVSDDYTINVSVSDTWPERLHNLLESKVQDYLAHATLAGWLSGFANLTVGNYKEIAVADLESIVAIITRVEPVNKGKSRHGDAQVMDDGSGSGTEGERAKDSAQMDDGSGTGTEGVRATDSAQMDDGSGTGTEGVRATDSAQMDDGSGSGTEGVRATDSAQMDDGSGSGTEGERIEDNACFRLPHEHLDFSGTINHFKHFRK